MKGTRAPQTAGPVLRRRDVSLAGRLFAVTATPLLLTLPRMVICRMGRVVLEIPAGDAKASLQGQVVDAWQLTIADVGPAGFNAGKGGNFTLPVYNGEIPQGYFPPRT
jgi:hypothetical protein